MKKKNQSTCENRTKGFIKNPLKKSLLCFLISSVLVQVLHVHKALVHPFL